MQNVFLQTPDIFTGEAHSTFQAIGFNCEFEKRLINTVSQLSY